MKLIGITPNTTQLIVTISKRTITRMTRTAKRLIHIAAAVFAKNRQLGEDTCAVPAAAEFAKNRQLGGDTCAAPAAAVFAKNRQLGGDTCEFPGVPGSSQEQRVWLESSEGC